MPCSLLPVVLCEIFRILHGQGEIQEPVFLGIAEAELTFELKAMDW